MGFAVLLNEMMKLPLDKVAPIIAKAEHIVYADATRALRYQTGILVKNISQAEAEMISLELNNMGIGCFVMDENAMYHPADYYLLNTAILNDNAFEVLDLYGNVAPFDWANLMFISVGKIMPHKEERYSLGSNAGPSIFQQAAKATFTIATGIHISLPEVSEPKKQPELTKARFVIDIFLKPPQEAHFRIYSEGFNYSYLGSRIAISSFQNFKCLIEDIVRLAPQVFGNKGLSAFMGKGAPRDMEYPNIRVFDEENLWMLQIVWINLHQ